MEINDWNDFFKAVSEMRAAQKAFLRYKEKNDLRRAKELKKAVDGAIVKHNETLHGRGKQCTVN